MVVACISSYTPVLPASPSIQKFISDQPYLSMLETKCTTMNDLQQIHAHIIKTGLAKDHIAASRVLSFCATSPAGNVNYAYSLFSQLPNRNLFIWNTIIRGFSQSSTPQRSISLFIDMLGDSSVEPNRLTYPSLFKAYARLGLPRDGAQLHGRVVKLGLILDGFVRNTVIHMYANCGFLSEARELFNGGEDMDVVAWNSMIMGLAKCGDIDEARGVFDEMPQRNTVSWNSMISGYVRNGKWDLALDLFTEMQLRKIEPSEFTLVSLLNASGCLGAIKQGEWIHGYMRKNNIKMNVVIVTAIIGMYCKCGSVEAAREVFETAPVKGLSCWNSMILGLAVNGCADEAIEMFATLESSSSLKPDGVTFIGILMACNHSGLVDKAKHYFKLMTGTYKIEPSIEHYGCMVDVLGRAGLLVEAAVLIRSMSMTADEIIWGSFLSSSRRYGNIEMARWASLNLLELDSDESSGHVLMSNVYAASGDHEKAIHERSLMKEKQTVKQPGASLIEVNGEVHEFVAGGKLHPEVMEIYSSLMDVNTMLRGMENVHNGEDSSMEELMNM